MGNQGRIIKAIVLIYTRFSEIYVRNYITIAYIASNVPSHRHLGMAGILP